MSIETTKSEMQREKRTRQRRISKNWENYKRCNIVIWILGGKERNRRNIWSNSGCEFSKINDRCQTAHPGNSSRIYTENKTKQKTAPRCIIFKLWKHKDKESLARDQETKIPYLQRSRDKNYTDIFRREWVEIFKVLGEKSPTNLEFCIKQKYALKEEK